MKKLWWVLQVAIVIFVASVALQWPASPVWEVTLPYGYQVRGFASHDEVLLLIGKPKDGEPLGILKLDARTGESRGQLTLKTEPHWRVWNAQVIQGGQAMLVERAYIDPRRESDFQGSVNLATYPRTIEVIDAATGASLSGPFAYEGNNPADNISPDGKWMWAHYEVAPHYRLIELATGATVRRIESTQAHRMLWRACYSPDGTATAVQWLNANGQFGIDILDLPSGQTRFSMPLPPSVMRTWSLLSHWQGDRLYVYTTSAYIPPYVHQEHCVSFRVEEKLLSDMREEPALSGFIDNRYRTMSAYRQWRMVDDTLVVINKGYLDGKPAWITSTFEWLDKKMNTTLRMPFSSRVSLRFVDVSTGRELGEVTSPKISEFRYAFSQHARYLASQKSRYPYEDITMWDTRGGTRWPWAVGVGLGSWLLLRWLATRRGRARPTPTPS